MKRIAILIAVLCVFVGFGISNGFAQGKTRANPTWATLDQRATKEIKHGGIYSRRWGAASPKLKAIVTQMILMKFGHGYIGQKALCYAQRESGLNPLALSSTNDHHVFQLNWSAHHNTFDYARLDEPDVGYGIIAGWRLSKGGRDFSAWAGGSHSCP